MVVEGGLEIALDDGVEVGRLERGRLHPGLDAGLHRRVRTHTALYCEADELGRRLEGQVLDDLRVVPIEPDELDVLVGNDARLIERIDIIIVLAIVKTL